MIKCHLCEKEFDNNSGGQLTNHLRKCHNSSLKDWVVVIKYNGIEPKCICGLCNESPVFHRGDFRQFAKGHKNLEFRRKRYVELNGFPTCQNCGKETGFKRGRIEIVSFCSFHCSGSTFGFSMDETQEKIKETVREKYGVENILLTPENMKKSSDAAKKRFAEGVTLSEETKAKISDSSKKHWKDPEYAKKVRLGVRKATNKPEERERRRRQAIRKFEENPEWKRKFFHSGGGRKSKLHMKIREKLGLEELGFKSEISVGRFVVDEMHREFFLIVEINGDYIHANPEKYKKNDVIYIKGSSYTAQEKWEYDKNRTKKLQKLGFEVVIVWESDNLEEKKVEIEQVLVRLKEQS